MALQKIVSFVAGRTVTLNGTTYQPGEAIPNSVIRTLTRVSALLSRRQIVPEPDAHSRRTNPLTPAVTHLAPSQFADLVDEAPAPPAWQATTAYELDDVVSVTGGTLTATVAGTSDITEPELPALVEDTVVDGTVTWSRTT